MEDATPYTMIKFKPKDENAPFTFKMLKQADELTQSEENEKIKYNEYRKYFYIWTTNRLMSESSQTKIVNGLRKIFGDTKLDIEVENVEESFWE